jgi:hypothetical protein
MLKYTEEGGLFVILEQKSVSCFGYNEVGNPLLGEEEILATVIVRLTGRGKL